jgi:hypothetical protein
MKIGGKEIYKTFFVQVEDKRHKCKSCDGVYSQDIKKGYTNLVTHIQKEHKGWEDMMKVNDDNNPFFHKKGNNIFNWLSWIIEDNLPFTFCERPNTRKFSKLDSLSVNTLMKYIKLTTERVEKKIADSLPNEFGIIIDGWKEGTTHYIAVFASYANTEGVGNYPLLAIAPPFDETTYTAENHKAFIGDVLELYGKSLKNLIYLVADNAAVNTRLADLLGIAMIGCASHRFNLACKKYLESNEEVLQKIQSLMTTLRQVKQAGKLRTKTDLEPIIRNVTRWSSTFEMVKRFLRLLEFIDTTDEALAVYLPTPLEMITLKDLMKDLEQFQSTTLLLQEAKRNLQEVRSIFDEMLKHYPSMNYYLSSDGGIVHSTDFEIAIVKVIDDDLSSLDYIQNELLEPFRQANNTSVGVGISPVKPDTPYALQALKKKRKVMNNEFIDLSFIPPTSNIVERLFSAARLVLTDYRKSMSPYTFECVMFLKMNRKLWDASLVSNIVAKA